MTAAAPLVSVLIVTRNRSQLVTRAIQSALAQTGVDVEVLVFDDASEDDTVSCCEKVDGKVRVFATEERRGPLVARNLGLNEAQGDYVVGLDDDAWFSSPETISRAVELFESDAEIGALGLAFFEPDRGQPAADKTLRHGDEIRSFRGCAYALRKSAALEVAGFREELLQQGEERDLAIRLRHAGYRLVFCDGAPVIHLFSPAGRVRGPRCRPGARNNFLFEWWYAPAAILPLRLAAVTINTLRYKVTLAEIPARIAACLAGWWGGWKYRRLRAPVAAEIYHLHRSLPGDAPDRLFAEQELLRQYPPADVAPKQKAIAW